MQKKKSSVSEKKRKHSRPEERHDSKRRSSETNMEMESKAEQQDEELDRIGSDIEEGGLDLSILFKPITAFISNRKEMLEQCFNVLGEKKLKKMLPDELKGCSLEEVRQLCCEQMELISDKNVLQILAGEEVTSEGPSDGCDKASQSQQDNNVDSTSCLKVSVVSEEVKQEGAGSGDESDVLSINADMGDSDIEGAKEEPTVKPAVAVAEVQGPKPVSAPQDSRPPKKKKEIESDIDRSVSEILSSGKEDVKESSLPVQSEAAADSPPSESSHTPPVGQPTLQQLELLELEMRARAIKALMNAGKGQRHTADKKT